MLLQLIEGLGGAFSIFFNIQVIISIFGGVLIGLIVGCIPGIGALTAIGILVPFTFYMDPVVGLTFLLGIFKGSLLGGSFSSILLNIPGTSAAAATTIDGYPLKEKGQSKKALQCAIFSSALADLCSDIYLIFFSLFLVRIILKLGPSEVFWVILFSLVITASLAGSSLWKGLLSMSIGLLFGTIGMDLMVGTPRLGIIPVLGRLEGLPLLAVLLGIFAISEFFTQAEKQHKETKNRKKISSSTKSMKVYEGPSMSIAEIKEGLKAFISGTVIGTVIGTIPGIGSTAGGFISHGVANQLYKGNSSTGKFGEGAFPGVIAAEAGNSSVSGSNMLPLLTLGIPGNATAALLLGAMMLQGIRPGPLIFQKHGEIIFGVFLALIIANFVNMFLANVLLKPLTKMLTFDIKIIFPLMTLICFLGVYVNNYRVLDLGIMVFFGILSWFMKKSKIPVVPMAIAFILSRDGEIYFRTALAVSGDFSIFVSSIFNIIMIILIIITVLIVVIQRFRGTITSE